ncbi:MAG TPA: SUF system NifU family Fe-S cluster assembly protein [Gemmatimonas sp.]|nr:SUF system NifU family Fe-S cluster assembly protein [Gemmatimonas sp.]
MSGERRADGSGASLSAMYQDTLLAHHRAPHNRRELLAPTGRGARKNPLCGDEIRVDVQVRDGLVADVAFGGRGCSIATASASMLTDVVCGLSRAEALVLCSRVEEMLHGGAAELPAELDALRGVAPFPARHGCATMPWAALRDALG